MLPYKTTLPPFHTGSQKENGGWPPAVEAFTSLVLAHCMEGGEGDAAKEERLQYFNNLCDFLYREGVGEKFSTPDFLAGLQAYDAHPYQRVERPRPCIWQEGSARLLDYGLMPASAGQPVILFVPSLINRSYILDLNEERSLLGYLAREQLHPYMIEWGEPTPDELGFSCEDYIRRVMAVIALLHQGSGQPVIVVGYCMGGLMALAATLPMQDKVKALGFLATPWDFHAMPLPYRALSPVAIEAIGQGIQKMEKVPKSLVQAFFYSLNPQLVHDKFAAFSTLDSTSREAQEFVAVEHWVRDGISITSPIARECLVDWGYYNQTLQKKWRIGGNIIDPSALRCESFIALAEHDHIVPLRSALPLASLVCHPTVVTVPSGHVGMIIGRMAGQYLGQPLKEWLKEVGV